MEALAFVFLVAALGVFIVSWLLSGGVLFIIGLGLKVGFFALAVYLPIAMVRWMMGK